MGENENRVTVVDAIMGAGKTSWLIQHINESAGAEKSGELKGR